MPEDNFDNQYEGRKLTVVHCDGARDTFDAATQGVDKNQIKKYKRNLIMQIKRLADGGRLSSENFRSEGGLPNKKKFYAFKKIPIRGYCWFSSRLNNTVFISHYVHKKKDKLDKADIDKVGRNWRRIEENNDEC